ncbi:MAG: hypothetical protein WCP39_06100 [Chlamydiota bacterium]
MFFRYIFLSIFVTASFLYSTDEQKNPPRWSGFTIGINLGALVNATRAKVHPKAYFHERHDTPYHFDNAAFTGGVVLGGSYQISRFVGGLFTDFNYTMLNRTNAFHLHIPYDSPVPLIESLKQKIPWFGTLRPRIGIGFKEFQVFLTGGLAYGQVRTQTIILNENTWYTGSKKKIQMGWTAGGGIEHSFYEHWSFLVEYLYVSLGSQHYKATSSSNEDPGAYFTARYKTPFHCFRVGLNYKL